MKKQIVKKSDVMKKSVDTQKKELQSILPNDQKEGTPVLTIQVGEIVTQVPVVFGPLMEACKLMGIKNRTIISHRCGVKIGLDII